VAFFMSNQINIKSTNLFTILDKLNRFDLSLRSDFSPIVI
jgi:hypothetical protein